MASCSGGRKKRLVSSLDGEVLERLSMKLNPRMLMKDYQSLAGRLKYTYEYICNFQRERDPTLALLRHWWSSKRGREKTVSVLIEHLSEMERDDAVDLLTPYEFYGSHEASEYDENAERPVVAGATDLNMNPYNPHFPANENHQQQANRYGALKPDLTRTHFNGHQGFPDRRVDKYQQQSPNPQEINAAQHPEHPNTMHLFQLDQKMSNLRLNHTNNYPDYHAGMMPSISGQYPSRASYPSSVSSSMDSVQFEKHFTEKESVAPKPVPYPGFQPPEEQDLQRKSNNPSSLQAEVLPQFQTHKEYPFDQQNSSAYQPTSPDEFYGARRDLRIHYRPQPLDGSSLGSNEAEMRPGFMELPRRRMMMGDNKAYMRTGVDMPNYWPYYDYGMYGGGATAETHSITVAADKVALVIGNQDYAHEKLRGLLYPEQDASDVAETLRSLDFKVISLINLTLSEMRTAMLAFCCLLGRGVYGVVYYAGHAYEDNGENYLLPVDSDIKYNREHSLRTQEILEAMQQCETSLNLLIIDACRVSLPNKFGTKVPRIKRNAIGNNIFAYSCCSQQESLEKLSSHNGMYCQHLLKRLREDRRVENVLMDVATDFARAYGLPQRPCLETDTQADFRLTDRIQPDIIEGEYHERCRRWTEANRHPHRFSLHAASLQISLDFKARFGNVLCVSVVTEKRVERSVTEFHLTLETVDPLSCVQTRCQDMENETVICRQTFEISNLQKHIKLQSTVLVTLIAMFRENGQLVKYEKELDLGWPLVSSITCLWDRWLLGDRCKATVV